MKFIIAFGITLVLILIPANPAFSGDLQGSATAEVSVVVAPAISYSISENILSANAIPLSTMDTPSRSVTVTEGVTVLVEIEEGVYMDRGNIGLQDPPLEESSEMSINEQKVIYISYIAI